MGWIQERRQTDLHAARRAWLPPRTFLREFDRKQATYNRLHPDTALPRLRLHDLRHSWATVALQAGIHPKIVSERLGHTKIAIALRPVLARYAGDAVMGSRTGVADDLRGLVVLSTHVGSEDPGPPMS